MIVCVLIPDWPVAVARALDPDLAAKPVIIRDTAPHPAQVYAGCERVAQHGVRPPMPLWQAQRLCPDAVVIPANHDDYQTLGQQLWAVLLEFSERVELSLTGQTMLGWVEIRRLNRADTRRLVQDLGRAVRDALGISPAIGVAGGKFPAQVAALAGEPNKAMLIEKGGEATFIAPFPVQLLPLENEMARRLRLLGIRTIGQLAAIPAGAMLAQFGPAGHLLYHLARGYDPRAVVPTLPQESEQVFHEFEDPVADKETLRRVIFSLIGPVTERLHHQALLCRRLSLQLELADRSLISRTVTLRQPTAQAHRLTQRLVEVIDRLQVRQGIIRLTLSLPDLVSAVGEQLELWPVTDKARLEPVIADLIARYGACFYQVSFLNGQVRFPERRFRLDQVSSA